MALSADNQIELNGVTIGPGTDYDLVGWNPWEAPDFRTSELHRGQLPGVVAGTDMLGAKRVQASVLVRGSTQAAMLTNLQALQAAWSAQTEDTELYFTFGGATYYFTGRPRGATVKGAALVGRNMVSTELRFIATDPYYYEDSDNTSDTASGWGGSDAGLDLSTALSFPLDLGGTAHDGILQVEVTAPGPVPFQLWARRWQTNNFELRHLEQGRTISLNPGTNGITNTWWIVDTKTREASTSTGGTSSFAPLANHDWFWLTPGTNTLKLVAGWHPTYPNGPEYKIIHRNAYL